MESIFEFIFELILEGSVEISKSSKIPKWIRYPLIVIIALFFIAVIGIILLAGILSLKENIFIGIFLILVGLLMLTMSILKFREMYWMKVKKK